MDDNCAENVINMMTNEFPTNAAKKTYSQCVFLEKEGSDYGVSKSFAEMLQNEDFYNILEELIDFGISRYKENFSMRYQDTDLKEIIMPNTDKTAVEIEWELDTPVREDIYEYIING